uniref:Uncharacterized protein n=1 Tax=Oryza brachyantha TaxID=4533 RepID=J3LVE1_ORYBR
MGLVFSLENGADVQDYKFTTTEKISYGTQWCRYPNLYIFTNSNNTENKTYFGHVRLGNLIANEKLFYLQQLRKFHLPKIDIFTKTVVDEHVRFRSKVLATEYVSAADDTGASGWELWNGDAFGNGSDVGGHAAPVARSSSDVGVAPRGVLDDRPPSGSGRVPSGYERPSAQQKNDKIS